MAEAYVSQQPHRAKQTIDALPTSSEFYISWSQNGLDIHIPPPQGLWRWVRGSFVNGVTKVSAMVYPIPFSVLITCAAASCVYAAYVPQTSWLHRNPVSVWLRYFDSIVTPFSRYIPSRYQAPALCAKGWTVGIVVSTILHRFSLRRILQYKGWMMEKDSRHLSWRTRLWLGVLRTFFIHPTIPATDVYERSLPSVPLPPLTQTVNRYLSSMRPIYHQKDSDVSEWLELRRAAESFLLNEGPPLQRQLRLLHVMKRNYVSEWWTQRVFLSARDSLCLNSNFFAMPFASYQPTTLPEARAAVLIYLLTQLKIRIEKRTLCPMMCGPKDTIPLSMSQYFRAFNTTRIPGREIDVLEHFDGAEYNYIVILHRGRVYQMPVVDPKTGKQLTPHQLEVILSQLLQEVEEEVSTGRDESEEDDAESTLETLGKRRSYRVAESLIPALTTAPRALWADIRTNHLLNDGNNHHPLRVIEKSMFVVSFDERCGTGLGANTSSAVVEDMRLSSECASYLSGNGSNLWCDKSFNLVVRADGSVGFHVEHSWNDMSTFLTLIELVSAQEESSEMWYDVQDGHARRLPSDMMSEKPFVAPSIDSPLSPRRLRFTIRKHLSKAIREAHTNYLADVASQLDLSVVRYDTYGRDFINKNGCTADAWMQMAIQLAYYLDQGGHFSQIYESVSQQMYAEGRTEAVRSVTDSSSSFVKAMACEELEEASAPTEAEKLSLLLRACENHKRLVQEAMAGRGIDRHLFALSMESASEEVPSDFLTCVLRRMKWKVSSAQVRQRYLSNQYHPAQNGTCYHETVGSGFGPVAADGYGVSYCFCKEEVLYITISSYKACESTSSRALGNRIVEALNRMGELH